MRKITFPPVETANEDGIVAVGGDLEIDTLLTAYKHGIFPWPISTDLPLAWFSPDPRGIIHLEGIHISKSFQKFLKKNKFNVTYNLEFQRVIELCAKTNRKNQASTWITPEIIEGYVQLFSAGYAYSVEVWNGDELVAGLYGVCIGNFISGESMFTIEDNASKYALFCLLEKLKNKGIFWIDTQMVTPVVESFGGRYISRPEFLHKISGINWTRRREEIF